MTVKELEKAVAKPSEAELAEFRAWFQQFDMDEWDRRSPAIPKQQNWIVSRKKQLRTSRPAV